MAIFLTTEQLDQIEASDLIRYNKRREIAKEINIKQKEIYAKYNPTINELKAQKKAELEALYQWREALYKAENL